MQLVVRYTTYDNPVFVGAGIPPPRRLSDTLITTSPESGGRIKLGARGPKIAGMEEQAETFWIPDQVGDDKPGCGICAKDRHSRGIGNPGPMASHQLSVDSRQSLYGVRYTTYDNPVFVGAGIPPPRRLSDTLITTSPESGGRIKLGARGSKIAGMEEQAETFWIPDQVGDDKLLNVSF